MMIFPSGRLYYVMWRFVLFFVALGPHLHSVGDLACAFRVCFMLVGEYIPSVCGCLTNPAVRGFDRGFGERAGIECLLTSITCPFGTVPFITTVLPLCCSAHDTHKFQSLKVEVVFLFLSLAGWYSHDQRGTLPMTTGRLPFDLFGRRAIGSPTPELANAVYIYDGFVFTLNFCSCESEI